MLSNEEIEARFATYGPDYQSKTTLTYVEDSILYVRSACHHGWVYISTDLKAGGQIIPTIELSHKTRRARLKEKEIQCSCKGWLEPET